MKETIEDAVIVTNLPALFNVTDARLAELRQLRDELAPIEDEETFLAKKEVQKLYDKTESGIEKTRVKAVAPHLEAQRAYNAYAKKLVALIATDRKQLDAEIEAAEAQRREAKLAVLKAEEDARLAKIKAEQEALAAERKALEAEKAKVAAAQAELAAKAKAEQEAIAAANKAESERLAKEAALIEEGKKAIQRAKEAAERAEFEALAKAKAEEEAQERLKRQAADEEAKRAALEAARPDVEKVHAFGASLRGLVAPTVTNQAASAILAKALTGLNILASQLEAFKL